MSKEFKRMQELAGLTEIKVNQPGRVSDLIAIDDNNPQIRGTKEIILNYIVDNITLENFGYKTLPDGSISDLWDDEPIFTDIEDFKNSVWDDMTNGKPLGGTFIVKKLGS